MSDQGEEEPRARGRRQLLFATLGGLLVLGFVGLLIVGLIASKTSTALDDAIAAGEPRPAPDFSLPLLANARALQRADKSELSLRDLRGSPVVLNFWASWCVPCESEAPRLEDAWLRHRKEGTIVLGVDVQDLSGEALEFIRRHRQSYPSVRDRGEDTYRAYGLTGVPETFFIDRAGLVRAHVIGEISTRQLEEGIALAQTTDVGAQ